MRTTVNDIARATGLSAGTVSRALDTSGKYYVSVQTRQKVTDAARELRYRPNLVGRALVAGSTKLVSLVSAAPFSGYYTSVGQRLSRHAALAGYSLVNNCAFDVESVPDLAFEAQKPPGQDWLFGVDGIVVIDAAPWQEEYVRSAIEMHIPVVGIGIHPGFDTDWVFVDLQKGVADLLRHLIGQGCRSIVLMSDPGSLSEVRGDVYRRVMSEAGLPEKVRIVPFQRMSEGRQAAIREVQENGAPDAFFCVNDVIAIGCCRGVNDLGLRIPEDVAVAGCDGIEETEYLSSPLTTVVQPMDEMCQMAWDLLEARIDGFHGPKSSKALEARLVVRASTSRSIV